MHMAIVLLADLVWSCVAAKTCFFWPESCFLFTLIIFIVDVFCDRFPERFFEGPLVAGERSSALVAAGDHPEMYLSTRLALYGWTDAKASGATGCVWGTRKPLSGRAWAAA